MVPLLLKRLFLPPLSEIEDTLLEVNVFAGNIDYLNKKAQEEKITAWLATKTATKVSFLKLRALSLKDPLQKKALETSMPIAEACGEDITREVVGLLCKRRLEREKHRQGSYIPASPLEAKLLQDPKKLRELNVTFVRYLCVDANKSDGLNQEARARLEGEDLTAFNQEQLRHLSPFHFEYLSPEQIALLPAERVGELSKPEQFITLRLTRFGEVEEHFILRKEQIKGLKPHQKDLISSVNPDLYCYFEQRWQIEALHPSQAGRINPKYAPFLTIVQLENMDPEAFTKEMLLNLTAEQSRHVPIEFAMYIADKVNEEQVKKIGDPTIIPRLELLAASFEGPSIRKGLWTSWIAPPMVPYICEEQAPFLVTQEQIILCPQKFLPALTASQLATVGAVEEFDEVLRSLSEEPLNVENGELSWVDKYCAVKERIMGDGSQFFNSLLPYAHKLEELSLEAISSFRSQAVALKEKVSVTHALASLYFALQESYNQQLSLSERDHTLFLPSPLPSSHAIRGHIKRLNANTLGDCRFRLSHLAHRHFSPAALGISTLSIYEGVKKKKWDDGVGTTLLGGLIGVGPGVIIALEGGAILGPLGFCAAMGALTYGAMSATKASYDHYAYKDRYDRYSSIIKESLPRYSMSNIEGHISNPSDTPGWPHSTISSKLEVRISCDLEGRWKTKVTQTFKENRGKEEKYPIMEAGSSAISYPLMLCRLIAEFNSSVSLRMSFESNSSAILDNYQIRTIPRASVDNCKTAELKKLCSDYEELLLHKSDPGSEVGDENSLKAIAKSVSVVEEKSRTLIPLCLPKGVLDHCDTLFRAAFPISEYGTLKGVRRYYSTSQEGEHWAIKIGYSKGDTELAFVTVARIDSMTMNSYRPLRQKEKELEVESVNVEEFLLQAFYGRSLIGKDSKIVRDVVAPVEVAVNTLLFAELEAQRTKCWVFDCQQFSGERSFCDMEIVVNPNEQLRLAESWRLEKKRYSQNVESVKAHLDRLMRTLQVTTTLSKEEREAFVTLPSLESWETLFGELPSFNLRKSRSLAMENAEKLERRKNLFLKRLEQLVYTDQDSKIRF